MCLKHFVESSQKRRRSCRVGIGLWMFLGLPVWAQTPTFVDIGPQVGLSPCPPPCALPTQPPYSPIPGDHHGPGAVIADFNNDLFDDLYLVEADPLGNGFRNRLYLSVADASVPGGRRFDWIAFQADGPSPAADLLLAGDQGNAVGAIAADYDNDLDQDIYVVNFDMPNVLYENQMIPLGVPVFIDVTQNTDPTPGPPDSEFGVGFAMFQGVLLDNSLSAAWADVDRDGDLDLYVGNHNGWVGTPLDGPFGVPGRRDVLYLSNVAQGSKTFTTDFAMPNSVGGYVQANLMTFQNSNQRFSSTNGVIFSDFDRDGWQDLLVTNKIGGPMAGGLPDADMLYLNQRGRPWAGYQTITWSLPNNFGTGTAAAMGVNVADYDNDGDMDIYSTDIDIPGPNNDLWINQLQPANPLSFVHSATLPGHFSWGAQFFDADNDGYLDLHITTQATDSVPPPAGPNPLADILYWQKPPGSFQNIAQPAGVGQIAQARGDLAGDLDKDGWVDLLVINVLAPPKLYRNTSAANFNNNYLHLRLVGDIAAGGPFKSSRDAIGAWVEVHADIDNDQQIEIQHREVRSGSSNAASTSSLKLEYGLGSATSAKVVVRWPSGASHTFQNVQPNQCAIVLEWTGQLVPGTC